MKTNYFFTMGVFILLLIFNSSCKKSKPNIDLSYEKEMVAFEGSVNGIYLKPNNPYILTINGKIGDEGNNQLLSFGNNGGEGYFDFEEVVTDEMGYFIKDFSKKLPVGTYNLKFLIKDKSDNLKPVYEQDSIIFTIVPPRFVDLKGRITSYKDYGSSSIVLYATTNFSKGTIFRINVGGTAKKILLRLLEVSQEASQAVGITGKYDVPENRIIEITLDKDYNQIKEISIHGNPDPFGFNLGKNNGPAEIISFESKASD